MIARRYFERLQLKANQNYASLQIHSLEEQSDFCNRNFSQTLHRAAYLIQKNFRLWFFKQKLQRLKQAYLQYSKQRKYYMTRVIQKSLVCYANNLRVKSLKFEKYKARRLIEIRRNVAILTIKNAWRSLKLSFRIIKERLVRERRIKIGLMQKQKTQKFTAMSEGGSDVQQRKTQLETAKIAHNISDYKETSRIPILSQRQISGNSLSLSKTLFQQTKSVIGKFTDCWISPQAVFRHTMINSPIIVESKVSALPPLVILDSKDESFKAKKQFITAKVTSEHFLKTTATNKYRYLQHTPRRPRMYESRRFSASVVRATISSRHKQRGKPLTNMYTSTIEENAGSLVREADKQVDLSMGVRRSFLIHQANADCYF